MGGFHGDGVWDLLGFAYRKPEPPLPQSARQTLALEVSDSSAASSEESPENRIWLRGAGQDPNAREGTAQRYSEKECAFKGDTAKVWRHDFVAWV